MISRLAGPERRVAEGVLQHLIHLAQLSNVHRGGVVDQRLHDLRGEGVAVVAPTVAQMGQKVGGGADGVVGKQCVELLDLFDDGWFGHGCPR